MKVQVTLLVNVDINRAEYAMEDQSTDEGVMEELRTQLDNGDVSFDDLIEQGSDYTITVVRAPE